MPRLAAEAEEGAGAGSSEPQWPDQKWQSLVVLQGPSFIRPLVMMLSHFLRGRRLFKVVETEMSGGQDMGRPRMRYPVGGEIRPGL